MEESLKKEIENIIKSLNLKYSVEEFKDKTDKIDWYLISQYQNLSEGFIREFEYEVNWHYISSFQKLSEYFIREFKDKLDWSRIASLQKLSEDFIREFKDKIYWGEILTHQTLSEGFIREFKNEFMSSVDYFSISAYQKLSEDFIREFKDKVNWNYISAYQKLSEDFIREFKDYVIWYHISTCQNLSENFIKEFKDNVSVRLYEETHREASKEDKIKEMKEYAEKHSLKFDGEYLYAFRDHDLYGRGMFNKTIYYRKGEYYRDFHCDMRKEELNSFGLGIFPKGNTPVKVKVEDWGVCVNREDGKCRVWGFEVI